jgi:NADPH-dependent 7-cyano-7-deazaguanine reductase QueF
MDHNSRVIFHLAYIYGVNVISEEELLRFLEPYRDSPSFAEACDTVIIMHNNKKVQDLFKKIKEGLA